MPYLKCPLDKGLILGDIENAPKGLVAQFDSAHADNTDKRSTCGYLFILNGSLIPWAMQVQRTFALSSTAAEYMAGTEAVREAIWIKGLTDAIFNMSPTHAIEWPIEQRGNNQGSLALADNPQFHQRTKQIELRHRFISDRVAEGLSRVNYVPIVKMLGDSLTKLRKKELHHTHWQRLSLGQKPRHDEREEQLLAAIIQSIEAKQGRKRKWPCVDSGNLFKDAVALKKDWV